MADQKLTALTETTSLDGTELFYVVEDPAGTPLSRKSLVSRIKDYILTGATFTGAVREAVVALTDAATIAIDASLGNIFKVTLGGNRTLGNPTNLVAGQKIVVRVKQDGTGSRTLAYDTKYRFGTDVTSPTLTTTAGKTDYLGFIYNADDDKLDCVAVAKGY